MANISETKIEAAAKEWAIKHSSAPDKCTPDWIITDFKGGVKFALDEINKQKREKSMGDLTCGRCGLPLSRCRCAY